MTTGHNGHHPLLPVTLLGAPRAGKASFKLHLPTKMKHFAPCPKDSLVDCFFNAVLLFLGFGGFFCLFVVWFGWGFFEQNNFFSFAVALYGLFQKAALALGSLILPSLLLQMVLLSCNSKIFGHRGQQVIIHKLFLASFSSQSGTRVEMHLLWTSFSH